MALVLLMWVFIVFEIAQSSIIICYYLPKDCTLLIKQLNIRRTSQQIKRDRTMKQKRIQKQKKSSKHRRHSSSPSRSSSNSRVKKQNRNHRHSESRNSKLKKQYRYQDVKKQYRKSNQADHSGWSSSERENFAQPESKLKQQLDDQNSLKKEQPNFQPSGILLQFYNAREGVALKFTQPPEAQAPTDEWRIYPFKNNEAMHPIVLKQSCYLVGKDGRVCDILCENQSISRQHAVLQFRTRHTLQLDGSYTTDVRPYVMDLESTNGTLLNNEKIEPRRYYELLNKDILKFGLSQREYVIFKAESSQ